MNWTAISLIVSTGLALFGWYYVGKQNAERDLRAKRREVQVQYLIEAYRRVESAANSTLNDTSDQGEMQVLRDLVGALGDIQLFGNHEQVKLAQEAAKGLVAQREADLNPLLGSLRHDLRQELGLPPADEGFVHLRYTILKTPTHSSP